VFRRWREGRVENFWKPRTGSSPETPRRRPPYGFLVFERFLSNRTSSTRRPVTA
jgi:hypothetical protein